MGFSSPRSSLNLVALNESDSLAKYLPRAFLFYQRKASLFAVYSITNLLLVKLVVADRAERDCNAVRFAQVIFRLEIIELRSPPGFADVLIDKLQQNSA
jgi:hypothetical protein